MVHLIKNEIRTKLSHSCIQECNSNCAFIAI